MAAVVSIIRVTKRRDPRRSAWHGQVNHPFTTAVAIMLRPDRGDRRAGQPVNLALPVQEESNIGEKKRCQEPFYDAVLV